MKRYLRLVAALLFAVTLSAGALAQCEDNPDWVCGRECTYVSGTGWACYNPSNPERACWAFGYGACGEDPNYIGCGPCFGGGGF